MKIIDEGKPEENIKEVKKAPSKKANNPPLIHLTDEERLFVENQLGMFRKKTDTNHTDTTQLISEIVETATDTGRIYNRLHRPKYLMPCQQTFL